MPKILSVYKSLIVGLLCLTSPSLYSLNIIMDLGDVAIETDPLAAFWHTGFTPFIRYIAHNPDKLCGLSNHIRYNCLFKFLNAVEPRNAEQAPARDEQGVLLPQIMCNWLTGTPSAEILTKIYEASKTYPFTNPAERILIRAMTKMMFTPATFVATRRLVPEVVAFVQQCKKDGHKLYILSNWDTESFALLQQRYPDFFALFDGHVISGAAGTLKPDPTPYRVLCRKYNLKPHETCMYDDRIENIETALSLGLHACHVTKKNRNRLLQKLAHYASENQQALVP